MRGKRVLVFGMARSGAAAAKLLAEAGATVWINDKKTEAELGDAVSQLHIPGVEWRLGEDPVALAREADCTILSPGIPDTHPAVAAAREAGHDVMAEIELAYRMYAGRMFAVTGTNGKTTTTTLLAEICKNAGHRAFAVGNIGSPFAAICAVSRPDDIAVCEVSSFQMETVSRFRPRIAAILNITPDHLNRHGTMEKYVALKERVFENMGGDDTLVLNYDDPVTRDMATRARCRVVWFSRQAKPPVGVSLSQGTIVYCDGGAERAICPADQVRIPGDHNLENAMAACAVAMNAGIPAPVIRHTLRVFAGVEHRIETVRTVGGVTFINDSKGTNTDSTIKAVRSMKAPTVLIAGGSDKKQSFSELGRVILQSTVQSIVLIGETALEMEMQLREVGFTDIRMAGTDFPAAIGLARSLAQPGWNVLLSPANASFDMFANCEQRGDIFKSIVGAMRET